MLLPRIRQSSRALTARMRTHPCVLATEEKSDNRNMIGVYNARSRASMARMVSRRMLICAPILVLIDP